MRPSHIFAVVTRAIQALSILLASGICPAQTSLAQLVIENGVEAGEVSASTLSKIISTAVPKARDEKELVLRLRVELLEQHLSAADNQDRAAVLALASTVIKDAKDLYGKADAKLIPLLRIAGNIYLRYKEPSRAVSSLTEAVNIANIVYGANDPAIRFVLADLSRAYAAQGNAARSAELAKRSEYLHKLAPASLLLFIPLMP